MSSSDSECSDFDYQAFHDCVAEDMKDEVKEFLKHPRFDLDSDDDYPAILIAVSRGHYEMAKLLLEAGYAPDYCSREGESPLSEAILCQDLDMVKLLVESGACINNGNGEPGIILATREDDLSIVRYFVEQGADDKSLRYACFEAARRGDMEVFEYLFALPGCNVSNNILIQAAKYGKHKVLSFLLGQPRVDIDYINKKGETPLNAAIEKGSVECVRLLIEAGSKITSTIVLTAFRQKKREISNIVFEKTQTHFVECIEELATQTDNDGNTIVHLALQQQPLVVYEEVVKLVKSFKNCLAIQNREGKTPLLIACKHNVDIEIFRLFVTKSDIRIKDRKGNSALMYAARNGRVDIVSVLLDKKVASKKLTNKKNKTVLHKAVKSQNLQLLELLHNRLLLNSINASDMRLRTPLFGCSSCVQTMRFLVDHGTTLTSQDNKGDNVLHHVVRRANANNMNSSLELATYIKDTCPELITMKNAEGKSPLNIAKDRHYNRSLHKLLKQAST